MIGDHRGGRLYTAIIRGSWPQEPMNLVVSNPDPETLRKAQRVTSRGPHNPVLTSSCADRGERDAVDGGTSNGVRGRVEKPDQRRSAREKRPTSVSVGVLRCFFPLFAHDVHDAEQAVQSHSRNRGSPPSTRDGEMLQVDTPIVRVTSG